MIASCGNNNTPRLLPAEAMKIAVDAYIYGYPLVTFDMVRQQQTNVATPDPERAPMGQMIKIRSYPAVDNHCCAAPNADTLYTMVWLDVSNEPWVLTIPDMGNRYFIIPMLDGYSEVFKVASPSTTGSKAQTYAITGPGWSGNAPERRDRSKVSDRIGVGAWAASIARARRKITQRCTLCRTSSQWFRSVRTASRTRHH